MEILTSLHGRRVGLGQDGSFVINKDGGQTIIPVGTNNVVAVTATDALTKDEHAGRIAAVTTGAATIALTLPAAAGTGDVYTVFVVANANPRTVSLAVANATDVLAGGVAVATDIGGVVENAAPTDDTITMNGTTTGGLAGSWVRVTDVATGFWLLEGFLVSSGAEATPFSAAVS